MYDSLLVYLKNKILFNSVSVIDSRNARNDFPIITTTLVVQNFISSILGLRGPKVS